MNGWGVAIVSALSLGAAPHSAMPVLQAVQVSGLEPV
jgi:hypothetical protein